MGRSKLQNGSKVVKGWGSIEGGRLSRTKRKEEEEP